MHFRRKSGYHMNGLWPIGIKWGTVLFITVLLAVSGCSKEDQPPPKGKNKVVVAIVKPAPEPVKEEPVAKVPSEEKAGTQETSAAGEQTTEMTRPQETTPKEPTPVVPSSPEVEKAAPSTSKVEASPPTETAVAASKASAPTPAASKKKELPALEKGVARVGEGESLSAFAAREDTCGDPLKWPNLYRLNLQRLAMLRTWKDIKEKPLQSGMVLRYLPPVDKEEARSPIQVGPWVVTVRSWQTPGRLTAPAIKLIENGFHVYITRAEVKGKQWLRLRVGFYPNKSEAMEARNKISEIFGNDDSWIARAGKEELEEFGK